MTPLEPHMIASDTPVDSPASLNLIDRRVQQLEFPLCSFKLAEAIALIFQGGLLASLLLVAFSFVTRGRGLEYWKGKKRFRGQAPLLKATRAMFAPFARAFCSFGRPVLSSISLLLSRWFPLESYDHPFSRDF